MRRGFQVLVSGVTCAAVTLIGVASATAQAPADPSKPRFALNGDVALVTMIVKPDKTADFEAVLNKLKEALNKSEKPERKQQASGWNVFKSSQPGPNGNVVYIMRIDPVMKDTEYDITMIISEVFPVEVQEVFPKYKEALVGRAITEMTKVLSMQQ
jgi:hypothetical protein